MVVHPGLCQCFFHSLKFRAIKSEVVEVGGGFFLTNLAIFGFVVVHDSGFGRALGVEPVAKAGKRGTEALVQPDDITVEISQCVEKRAVRADVDVV